jgi:hypothetical protein
MSDRRIKLVRSNSAVVHSQNYGAYRIRIDATEAQGPDIDKNVFIYKRMPPSPYNAQTTDVFEAIAGPPQLASFPVGDPNPDSNWPYYRLDYVELDVASSEQAESIWQEIKAEVAVLIQAMDRLDQLSITEEWWWPSPPPAP